LKKPRNTCGALMCQDAVAGKGDKRCEGTIFIRGETTKHATPSRFKETRAGGAVKGVRDRAADKMKGGVRL